MRAIRALAILSVSTFGLMSLAEDGSTAQSVQGAVQQLHDEITGKDRTVINFAEGSALLSDQGRTELTALINAVRNTSSIKETLILAYSDLDYPRLQKSDLPAKSRRLAQDRAEAVKSRIEQIGGKDITIHNMAKKSTWFEKMWISSDAQVKSEAREKKSDADGDDSFYQILGERLKKDGGPGKVVVVIRHQGNYSH